MAIYAKRRIRIENTTDSALNGSKVKVTNTVTGEELSHIRSIDVHMEPGEIIAANITYYEHKEDGSLVVVDRKPVEHQETVHDPELSIIALEQLSPLEKRVYAAIEEASQCVTIGERGNLRFNGFMAERIAQELVQAIQDMRDE